MKIYKLLGLVVMIGLSSLIVTCSATVDDTKAKETLKQYNIVDISIFENETKVTRNDCVALVMRSIGVPDNIFLESYTGTRMFYDFESTDEMMEYFQKCKFVSGTNYVAVAKKYTKVVLGEKNKQEESTIEGAVYFNFVRAVTTKEALAFMVRCLENTNVDLANIDATFVKAKELGLIKETDTFYENPDDTITPDDFCVLLQRFLYQPRYKYFTDYHRITAIDEFSTMTYLEYLEERETQGDGSSVL